MASRIEWRRPVMDLLYLVAVFIFMDLFRPDYVLIGVYIALIPYLILTKRSKWIVRLALATAVALVWVIIANGMYSYRVGVINLFGINVFTFLSWALGLYGVITLYTHINTLVGLKGLKERMLLFVAVFWPGLIIVESVAYHVLLFRNIPTGMFPGLPLCDCIHAPMWMQFAYLAMGPIYFALCEAFGVGNGKVK
jgi:hypothetical protein